jgi:hypothetical protein
VDETGHTLEVELLEWIVTEEILIRGRHDDARLRDGRRVLEPARLVFRPNVRFIRALRGCSGPVENKRSF